MTEGQLIAHVWDVPDDWDACACWRIEPGELMTMWAPAGWVIESRHGHALVSFLLTGTLNGTARRRTPCTVPATTYAEIWSPASDLVRMVQRKPTTVVHQHD